MYDLLLQLLDQPHEYGLTTFILGILFVLSVYHFLLFFQNRDKVYLYYSLYLFLIFLNQTKFVFFDFDSATIHPYQKVATNAHLPIMWLYNTLYFIFGFSFLNLKEYSKRWYSFIFKIVTLLTIFTFGTAFLAGITDNTSYISVVGVYMVPFLLLFGIIAYYPLFKFKMPLRGYIITGSFILYISSLFAYYLPDLDLISSESNFDNSVFYIGVVIENIIFSLGLGQKQKMILQDKNISQKKLIKQLKENQILKSEIQKQLEQNVLALSAKAENEKLEKLKVKYDKELAELKITSLRSQMNPHFIFNSLNAIKLYIIDNKKENAVYYINKFSKLIRKILAITREKEIVLSEEIETIKLYIDIENIRFNNEIESTFTVEDQLNLDTIKIPSLILQPFVENAIWHGLSLKKGVKKLHIDISKKEESHVEIVISDNGIGRERAALIKRKKIYKSDSIGINLTKERLSNFEKKYKNNYQINFKDLYDENKKATGTKIILKIPVT